MKYKNLDSAESFRSLLKQKKCDLKHLLTKERVLMSHVKLGASLVYNYAAMPVCDEKIKILQSLSDEMEVVEKYKALLRGERVNTGENRAVLHHLLRGNIIGGKIVIDGEDKEVFYTSVLQAIKEFSESVRDGKIKGSTGKTFNTVCQIGIGGSDLGPRALYLALKGWAVKHNRKMIKAEFISNVDPDDAADVLSRLDLERTLFILVSKSGTTEETLTNRALVLKEIERRNIEGLDVNKHFVSVTSKTSPLAKDPSFLTSFFIDDYIGGRYSSTSAVGGVLLSLSYGFDAFSLLLEGANEEDKLSLEKDIRKNGALLDALIGVYLRNVLLYPTTAILPYSQALSRFPAHLQQLDMESNGKSVNRDGEEISYSTGPVIFGESGTNGQHSFYQLLHQGTDIIPLQFIGFRNSEYGFDVENNGVTSQEKLNAALIAQIVAFALGQESGDKNKEFKGLRPSSLIYGDELNPRTLGALLSHYENKVMFQGFLWNINSFDQEGVQLGKTLAKKVISGNESDDLLGSYSSLLL